MRVPKSSVDAWHAFLEKVEHTEQELQRADELWYRGHTRSDYTLMPSLFRGYKKPNESPEWDHAWARESNLFWEFTARARELHATLRTDWDYLFAMQHYRTPTRLLDWTEVLGVAVYFAVLGIEEGKTTGPPPCVWLLNPYQLNSQSTGVENEDLYAPENIGWDPDEEQYYTYGELLLEGGIDFDWPLAIYPRQTNARIHAQRAWFTMHGDEFVPMESLEASSKFLRKIELPFEAIPAARRFLAHAGIDHYPLFADLESLSKYITEKNRP